MQVIREPRSPNRCDHCLTNPARESLERVRAGLPHPVRLTDTGRCGLCGSCGEVYDVAYLLLLRWHDAILVNDDPEAMSRIRAPYLRPDEPLMSVARAAAFSARCRQGEAGAHAT